MQRTIPLPFPQLTVSRACGSSAAQRSRKSYAEGSGVGMKISGIQHLAHFTGQGGIVMGLGKKIHICFKHAVG